MVEVGDTVLVYEPADCSELIGKGKYLGRVTLDVEEDDSDQTAFLFDTPKIELENGKIIYGYECWWISEKDAKAAEEACFNNGVRKLSNE